MTRLLDLARTLDGEGERYATAVAIEMHRLQAAGRDPERVEAAGAALLDAITRRYGPNPLFQSHKENTRG